MSLARPWVRRVEGLQRLFKEHFSTFAASASGRVVEIRAPRGRYFADPFVWTHEGRSSLFVEEFDYLELRGRICCVPLDRELRAGAPQPVFERRGHVSFPYLFEHADALYMVPETSAELCVDLYRCDSFPERWTFVRRLLDGINAADSAVLDHGGHWWLITSVRDDASALSRRLVVFFTDDLLAGAWHAHPINAQALYGDAPFGAGRNAGPVVRCGELLLRPTQDNRTYYGEGVRWMRIEALDEREFREHEFRGTHPLAQLSARVSPHHVARHGGLIAWDVRDRLGYWQHVPLLRRYFGTPLSPRARASSRLPARGLDPDILEGLRCSG